MGFDNHLITTDAVHFFEIDGKGFMGTDKHIPWKGFKNRSKGGIGHDHFIF